VEVESEMSDEEGHILINDKKCKEK